MPAKILLHTCCGDCLLRTKKLLEATTDFDWNSVNLFYHNPNIFPKTEYDARREALEKVNEDLNLNLIISNYEPKKYFLCQKSLYQNSDPNQSISNKNLRCHNCIYLRLAETFQYALTNDFAVVGTTMSASPYLNHQLVNDLGEALAKAHHLVWLNIPNQKLELHTSGFYKQNYCGCLFSLNEKVVEKYYAN